VRCVARYQGLHGRKRKGRSEAGIDLQGPFTYNMVGMKQGPGFIRDFSVCKSVKAVLIAAWKLSIVLTRDGA
jgi:hypothetical protein